MHVTGRRLAEVMSQVKHAPRANTIASAAKAAVIGEVPASATLNKLEWRMRTAHSRMTSRLPTM